MVQAKCKEVSHKEYSYSILWSQCKNREIQQKSNKLSNQVAKQEVKADSYSILRQWSIDTLDVGTKHCILLVLYNYLDISSLGK